MKKLIAVLFVIVIALTVMLGLMVGASAESLYIRKIVSIVYDDSGSMEGDKWAYANYATQSFCGMLNSEDQLFVTYMSHSQMIYNYNPEKVDLSSGGIQGSVNSIRNHTDSGSTPYTAVDIAYNKLKSVKDSNPNTQYWLVVITDGVFDECNSMTVDKAKSYLNKKFKNYTKTAMPNGSTPQVTFLGIGGVVSPDENQSKGIYTYSASDAKGIIKAMSDMADKISGRTRLQGSDVKKLDDRTIQVSSSIPLLNIAVFAQGSQAKVTGAVYGNEIDIPISRAASLSYPNYEDLVGGAFLLGDSENVIGSGTYNISFDQSVDLNDVIILFEPALETRMTIMLNGKELTDFSELDESMENDKVSVSFKIYEMGTEKEIDPSLMPPGTKFEITVSEDGKVVEKSSGEDMVLPEYILKNKDTEITASVVIDGFNPIDYSAKFSPTKYVPKIVYTISSDFGNNSKSIRLDDISGNKDMTVRFTVYADGVAITDPDAVRALNPVITCSPQGNSGTVTYSSDGKIVFTPNTSSVAPSDVGSFDVDVTCSIEDGTSAMETYTVLIATYEVIPTDATRPVKKTELFDNQVSVSFYVTKDGVKLDKSAVEKGVSFALNEAHSALGTNVVIDADGTITVTPYSDEQHTLTFLSWWTNWAYYFGLPGEDITVTMIHSFGSADGVIDVMGEDLKYIILNVVLPLTIEVVALCLLVLWICMIIFKPRFLPDASLYLAYISYGGKAGNRYHEIYGMSEVPLRQYNSLIYRLGFSFKAKEIDIDKNISVSAGPGGSIICHNQLWYKGDITPNARIIGDLSHPQYVKEYIEDHDSLKIKVINPYTPDDVHAVESIDGPGPETYYIHTDMANIGTVDGIRAIEDGTIFAYAIQTNN